MAPSVPPPQSVLCQGILQYLRTHPDAADSLEGIATWWLPGLDLEARPEAVQTALDQLVADRLVARFDLADGRTLYQSVAKVSGSHPALNPPQD